jgi:hypothetical protein
MCIFSIQLGSRHSRLTSIFLCVVLAGAIACNGSLAKERVREERRPQLSTSRPAAEALDTPVELSLTKVQLTDALERLGKVTNASIDASGLADSTAATPVTVNSRGGTLRSVLHLILDPIRLRFDTVENQIRVFELSKDNTNRSDEESEWIGRRDTRDDISLLVLSPKIIDPRHFPIEIIVENGGKRLLQCGETPSFLVCGVSVKDSAGHEVPYTTVGSNMLLDSSGGGQCSSRNLKPGETASWHADLARCFEELPDGDYTLAADVRGYLLDRESGAYIDKSRLSVKDLPLTVRKSAKGLATTAQ